MSSQMRAGDCPGCDGIVSFEIENGAAGMKITAGHTEPSCEGYKAHTDSLSVAKWVGLVGQDQRGTRADN